MIYPEERGDGTGDRDVTAGDDPACAANDDVPQTETTTNRRSRTKGHAHTQKPIYVKKRDQVYEDPDDDGEGLTQLELDEVTCGTCGEGGDDAHLMLCDGCDTGHHCYCVGLDEVPLEEWRCRICDDADVENSAGDGAAARTVASVRRETQHELSHVGISEATEARRLARQRAAAIRAARNTRLSTHSNVFRFGSVGATPESRAPRNETFSSQCAGTFGADRRRHQGTTHSGFANHTGTTPSGFCENLGNSSQLGSFHRGHRGNPVGGPVNDSRRAQIARVRELRLMWERYRAGEKTFGAEAGTGGGDNCETGNGTGGGYAGHDELRDGGRTVNTRVIRTNGVRTDGTSTDATRAYLATHTVDIGPGAYLQTARRTVDSPRSARRRAAAATLAGVGCRAEETLDAATDLFADCLPVHTLADTDNTRALKRPRRREVPVSTAATTSGRLLQNTSKGSGGDKKGKFAGVAFSPPKDATRMSKQSHALEQHPAKHDDHTGWTSSDEDDKEVLEVSKKKPQEKQSFDKEKPPQFLHKQQAFGFVPPGTVSHVPPVLSAKEAYNKRQDILSKAEHSGAPSKTRVIQMVKALLKPYWVGKKIKDATVFKTLAKRASDAARAASAAVALKHGAAPDADYVREEAIALAVRRAVEGALTRQGIAVNRDG